MLFFLSDYNSLPVEHQYLNQLMWLHETGIEKQLKLYSRISHKWELVATLLGFENGEITSLRRDFSDACERITAVLEQWLDNARNLPNASKYPKSWQGLVKLLKDAELSEVAGDLETALSSPRNSVRGTLS